MNKKLRKAALALSLAFLPLHVTAGGGGLSGGATEVTQILNQTQLVMQQATQLEKYATQINEYATQLQQLELQMKDLASGDLVGLSQQEQQILASQSAAQDVVRAAGDLYPGLRRLEDLARGAQHEWGASDLTWEEYIKRRQSRHERAFGRRAVLSAEEARVMNDVVEKSEVLRQYAAEIPHTQGSHESLQLLNGQVSLLNSTLQEQLRMNALASATQTEEQMVVIEERAERDRAHQNYNTYRSSGSRISDVLTERLK